MGHGSLNGWGGTRGKAGDSIPILCVRSPQRPFVLAFGLLLKNPNQKMVSRFHAFRGNIISSIPFNITSSLFPLILPHKWLALVQALGVGLERHNEVAGDELCPLQNTGDDARGAREGGSLEQPASKPRTCRLPGGSTGRKRAGRWCRALPRGWGLGHHSTGSSAL